MTDEELEIISIEVQQKKEILVEVNVLNKKDIPVEEIVQVYIKDLESEYAVKNTSLCGFQRVSLQTEERKKVVIEIARSSFEIVDINGNRYIDSHRF